MDSLADLFVESLSQMKRFPITQVSNSGTGFAQMISSLHAQLDPNFLSQISAGRCFHFAW